MTQITLADLATPCLLLDKARLERNTARMLAQTEKHRLRFRPHIKTCKSVPVAEMATGGRKSGVTASTLKEVDYFAKAGFTDILYAVGVAPNKFDHIAAMEADVILLTDHPQVARAAAAYTEANPTRFKFAIEVDCGEHRGGLPPEAPEIAEIARIFHDATGIDFLGLMTHGGHSYRYDDLDKVREVAAAEVAAVTQAADRVRAAGIPVAMVSVGSTPTVLFGEDFTGVTEARAGVHVFMDLSQYSRNVCSLDDIAVSVLATVIGHNRAGGVLTIDAGALALSKDLGANDYLPQAGYGLVSDPEAARPYDGLAVATVHQEHGTVPVPDDAWYERLPVGALVRVLPNHVCMTAAGHDAYQVLDPGNRVVDTWPRAGGWY